MIGLQATFSHEDFELRPPSLGMEKGLLRTYEPCIMDLDLK